MVVAVGADAPSAERTLAELIALEREIVEAEYVRRADALERVADAVRRLGEIGSPQGILERATEELGTSSEFDRVLLGEVRGDELHPRVLWSGRDPEAAAAALEALRRAPIRLEYPSIEDEVVRRQRTEIVRSGAPRSRAARRLAEVLDWDGYVVTALVIQGTTVGLLHADASVAGRVPDALDVEVTARYGEGLAGVFERAVLREMLQLHHHELRSAMDWMSARIGQLSAGRASRRRRGGRRVRVRPDRPRARRAAAARARSDQPRNRPGAGRPRRHGQVPRQEHPAQAGRHQPGRRGGALRPGPGRLRAAGRRREARRQLQRRLDDEGARARELLGLPVRPVADVSELRALIGRYARESRRTGPRATGGGGAGGRARAAAPALRGPLRSARPGPGGDRGAAEVTSPARCCSGRPPPCAPASAFDRAIVSLVRGGRMVAEAAYFAGDAAAATAVLGAAAGQPAATRALADRDRAAAPAPGDDRRGRRRSSARRPRHGRGSMGWPSYAAAPLVVGSHVIGVMHADRGAGQALDVLDRDVLWEFATGLAQAYETAVCAAPCATNASRCASSSSGCAPARASSRTRRSAGRRRAAPGTAGAATPGPVAARRRGRVGRAGRPATRRSRGVRGPAHPPRARRPAAAGRGRDEPPGRRRARDLERNGQVPRGQHPAQAARGQPGRGGTRYLRLMGMRAP